MKEKVSVIIPFLNESDNITRLCNELNLFYEENKKTLELEIVFVNDGSSDNTEELIRQHDLRVQAKIVRLTQNYGSHIAFRAGLNHCSYDIVTQTSSDLQNPLSLITDLLAKMRVGEKKLVIAQRRNIANIGLIERCFSAFYTFLIQKFAIHQYPHEGFDIFMIEKDIKDMMTSHEESNSSILLQIISFGFEYDVVTYEKQNRYAGRSKWTLSKKIKLLVDSFVAFSYAPIRFVSLVGILFFMFGIFWTIYIISRKLLYNDLASGWPALTSILLLGFGITNIGLGIIAEYLWRTLDASRKRPVYIIDQIIELKSGNL